MKLFASIVSLFIIGAATAQNPTILQGNYITNVFGNSNFVLNPNAQTNTANVAVSNATVTRSTTTPLVATSEFNITTSTATGFADWALRTFDQGMKGQNCEARFTYRGFSVGTTTAQILQGANVVAQLTLTPSTDPRIASINFPCGDLSAVTKFRLQQASASLTGTNEISGIYTGLATNMANVAQAEMIGTAVYQGGVFCGWSKTGATSGYESFAAAGGTCDWTSTGTVTPQTKLLKFDATLKPGKYQAILSTTIGRNNTSSDAKFVLTDGTNFSNTAGLYLNSTTTTQMPATFVLTFEVTATATKTIELKFSTGLAGLIGRVENYNNEYFTHFALYRFPSSSELVVTPERQNVWASAEWNNADLFQYFQVADPTGFLPYTRSGSFTAVYNGSAQAPLSATQVGFSVANLPVGKYEVRMNQGLRAAPGTAAGGDFVICQFRMRETTTNIPVGLAQQIGQTDSNFYVTDSLDRNLIGIFNNTSVGTRNFIFESNKVLDFNATNNGQCGFSTSAFVVQRPVVFTLIPLDQPSNSALYVQGPVKAAETGAAIPSGYLGQSQVAVGNTAANININTLTNIGGTDLTLQPGVYVLLGNISATSGITTTAVPTAMRGYIRDGLNNIIFESWIGYTGNSTARQSGSGNLAAVVNVTTATTYRLSLQWADDSGGGAVQSSPAYLWSAYSKLTAIRLN